MKVCNWTASNFGALPYESDFSLNQRFALANSLNAEGLVRSMNGYYTPISFSQPAHTASVHSSIRFQGDDAGEVAAFSTSAVFSRFLFYGRLRECPICAEAGYHSYLYQIRLLQQCPIHACPLISHCMYCGAAHPAHRDWRRAFDVPYGCIECGRHRSGARTTHYQHRELRGMADLVRVRLQPVFDWARQVSGCEFLVHAAENAYRDQTHDRDWQHELLLGAASQWTLPVPLFSRPRLDVSILGWHLRTLPLHGHAGWRYLEAREGPRTQAAWALAQRRVQQWQRCMRHPTENLSDVRPQNDVLRDVWSRRLRVRKRHGEISGSHPLLPFERESGGVPRLAAFAYYLGVQAISVWHAVGMSRERQTARYPLHSVVERDGIQRGWVFFPTVPGLDLRPFVRLAPA